MDVSWFSIVMFDYRRVYIVLWQAKSVSGQPHHWMPQLMSRSPSHPCWVSKVKCTSQSTVEHHTVGWSFLGTVRARVGLCAWKSWLWGLQCETPSSRLCWQLGELVKPLGRVLIHWTTWGYLGPGKGNRFWGTGENRWISAAFHFALEIVNCFLGVCGVPT